MIEGDVVNDLMVNEDRLKSGRIDKPIRSKSQIYGSESLIHKLDAYDDLSEEFCSKYDVNMNFNFDFIKPLMWITAKASDQE